MIKLLFKELNISTHNKLLLLQIIPLDTWRISKKDCFVGFSMKLSVLTIWNMYTVYNSHNQKLSIEIRNDFVWSSTKQMIFQSCCGTSIVKVIKQLSCLIKTNNLSDLHKFELLVKFSTQWAGRWLKMCEFTNPFPCSVQWANKL